MPKDYSLEDYSTPACIAALSIHERDMVMRFINSGEEHPELDRLIQNNAEVREFIDNKTEEKI